MATIFFMSFSLVAVNPAIIVVHTADVINIFFVTTALVVRVNRLVSHTPAVTKVDECTSEEVGVGAAMAAGSQAENGIWALLVIAAIITISFVDPIF